MVVDVFVQLDGNDFPDFSFSINSFIADQKGSVTQYVTNREKASLFLRFPDHCDAFRGSGRHRLFQQDVIALFQRPNRRLVVHPVLGTDDRDIRHPGLFQQIFPTGKTCSIFKAVHLLKLFPPLRVDLRNAHNFQLMRKFQGIGSIGPHPPVSRPDDHRRQRFHRPHLLHFRPRFQFLNKVPIFLSEKSLGA